jgi:putrescine transport system substrate-binding protein
MTKQYKNKFKSFKNTLKASALTLCITAASWSLQGTPVAQAEDNVLNVYIWSDYFDPAYVEKFEQKTGIKVHWDVYDSNEILEAKLMSGRSGYDLVVPSGAFLERQIQAGIYGEIPTDKLKNYGNLDPILKEKVQAHDAGNKHSVPYTWGTIGIAYNTKMIADRLGVSDSKAKELNTWDMLFDPTVSGKLADCGIALLDSPAEMMSIGLNYVGLDPNSEKKEDLETATAAFSKVRDNIRYFHSSRSISDLANGEICMAIGYNGDMLQAKNRAVEAKTGQDIRYMIPNEGTLAWFDLMAIPADAEHKENALKFIDFVLEPETGASIANFVYYAVANKAAVPLINDEVKNDPGIFPSDETAATLFAQKAHSPRYDRILVRAWTKLKSGR